MILSVRTVWSVTAALLGAFYLAALLS